MVVDLGGGGDGVGKGVLKKSAVIERCCVVGVSEDELFEILLLSLLD